MDCPVCKYPNPQGASHCGMCYEVFNRSAAQSYLHAVQRERREADGIPDEPQTPIQSQRIIETAKETVAKVDWSGLAQRAISILKRSQKAFWVGGALIFLWMVASFLLDPTLWFHLFGKKLDYSFPNKTATQYLVGMKQNIKIWSERQGRLDTPMEEFKLDEMGNVLMQRKQSVDKNGSTIFVNTKEWIQILNDNSGSTSHSIPKNHPTLAGARLVFDKKGTLLERHVMLSPRLAKSVPFIVPRFPKGSLRHEKTWNESVEWLDTYDDWKIDWAGTLHWTLKELEPCGAGTCARLEYTAHLKPQFRGGPSWLPSTVQIAGGTFSAKGEALYDAKQNHLVSNIFSYEGLVHIPIKDLGRIPWEQRIGRGVKGLGEIAIHFENKIDVRKN